MERDAIKRFRKFTGIPVGCMLIATEGVVAEVFNYYGRDNVMCPGFFTTAVLDQDGYYFNKSSGKHIYVCNNDGVIFFNIGEIPYLTVVFFEACCGYPADDVAPQNDVLPVKHGVEIVDMHCGDDGEGIVLVKNLSNDFILSPESSSAVLSHDDLVKVTRLSRITSGFSDSICDSVIRLDFSNGSYDVFIGHWNSGKIVKKEVSDGK